jgi:hypothetical protein
VAASDRKKSCLGYLWMFLQGIPGAKETIERELAGFAAPCARVLSNRGARCDYDEIWTEK